MSAYSRIKFKVGLTSYDLGYYEYVSFNYEGNVQTRIVPRALGVKIWNTDELGGGIVTVTVNIFVASGSRMTHEDAIYDLLTNVKGQHGSVSIENDTIELTDCYLKSFSQENKEGRTGMITLTFIKSA